MRPKPSRMGWGAKGRPTSAPTRVQFEANKTLRLRGRSPVELALAVPILFRSSRRTRPSQGTADPHQSQAGQALVELALVVMIMLVMAMGVFDLGRAFDALVSATHAARDGARAGMAPAVVTNGERVIAAQNAAMAVRPDAAVVVSACLSEEFTVTVRLDVPAVTPMMGTITVIEEMRSRCRNS